MFVEPVGSWGAEEGKPSNGCAFMPFDETVTLGGKGISWSFWLRGANEARYFFPRRKFCGGTSFRKGTQIRE